MKPTTSGALAIAAHDVGARHDRVKQTAIGRRIRYYVGKLVDIHGPSCVVESVKALCDVV